MYLGCGYTFAPGDDRRHWKDWDFIITTLLEADVWVTLDFNAKYCEDVLNNGWSEYNKFVAMIAVRLSYIDANQL